MVIADIRRAKLLPSISVEHARNGEEVVVSDDVRPMVRPVPIVADESPRSGGRWKGRVRITDDFDDWPEDVAAAFGIRPR